MLYTDPLLVKRWYKGEIGELLDDTSKDNSEKYDYFVELKPNMCVTEDEFPFFKRGDMPRRDYYFYKNEVEIIL